MSGDGATKMSDRNSRAPIQRGAETAPSPGTVLVVDDDHINRDLLRDILGSDGHVIDEAEDGSVALRRLSDTDVPLPDVVLLDIVMPGPNGFEVCRRIKGDPRTSHLPVIMVTGLTERKDRLEGMRNGADDFVTKPFDGAEVALRVRNAISSKRLYDRAHEEYQKVLKLEEVRDSLIHMVVHDLRQPLTALTGFVDYLKSSDTSGGHTRVLTTMKSVTDRMAMMIASLLDIRKLEEGKMPVKYETCNLAQLLPLVVERIAIPPTSLVEINLDAGVDPADAECDSELIGRVITNLADNALKHAPKGSSIAIGLSRRDDLLRVDFVDSGNGIPEEFHERIFEKFGQVSLYAENHRFSWGLGLTFCKMAVEAHHGSIGVESEPGRGSDFWFAIPVHQPNGSG